VNLAGEPRLPRVLVAGAVLGQPMGGVRRHNQELLPRVARLLADGGGGLAVLEPAGGLGFALPAEVTRLRSGVPAGPPALRAFFERRALERELDAAFEGRAPFDLVHTAHLPAPRSLSVPFTLTLHDLRSVELSFLPLLRRLAAKPVIARAVRDAAAVITVSRAVADKLVEYFHAPRAKLWRVPNAADHLDVLPRRPGPDAPILHVGHLEPRKNLDLLLRALAAEPSLPKVVLAGSPKKGEERRLRALAESLGVAHRVDFLGPVTDAELAELYATAGCLAFPSHLEGFGVPVLEAQRARCPVAVARDDALTEVAGPDAFAFSPHDAGTCARAIAAALAAPSDVLERSALRAEGARWQDSAERWVEAWVAARGAPDR